MACEYRYLTITHGRLGTASRCLWLSWIQEFSYLRLCDLRPGHAAQSRGRSSRRILYAELRQNGVDVLLDDRDISAGKKLSDAPEMLGARARVVVNQQALDKGCLEWLDRKNMIKRELQFDGTSALRSLHVAQVLDMLRGA